MASAAAGEAVTLIERGIALEREGHLEEALEAYDAAVRLTPAQPRAHLNRGNALIALGRLEPGLKAYAEVSRLDPAHAGAYLNRGNALLGAGRLEDALASYAEATTRDPGYADGHVARGCVEEDLGRFDAAIESYRAALALRPDHAAVHSNLGNALRRTGRFQEALDSHRRALEIDPALAQGHTNLGNVLKDLGKLEEAEASYRRAVALEPGNVDARSNLLFLHNYRQTHSPEALLAEAKAYGAVVSRVASKYTSWRCVADVGKRLRVGLVSGDLRRHPVAYFLEGMLRAAHGGERPGIEWIAYATTRREDETSARLKACCHRWYCVEGMPDAALAAQIHESAVDVLIDLSGHTAGSRLPLFAWKPSPVQVTWLGYFATTGVAEIDYLIADPWTLPDSQSAFFTEKIWRLPQTRLCFTAPEASPAVARLPASGGAPVTFGCFNNLTKIGEPVIDLWARVLRAVPTSRLLLKSPQLGEAAVRARLVAAFSARGVDAERIHFEGLTDRFDYLSSYGRVDIALDPFPFTGGTTTAEALWMGVPVLTLEGTNFLARQGVGLLVNAGMGDWVAADPDEYVRLAAFHAGDLDRLARLRREMRLRLEASPVMDEALFSQRVEGALQGMWRLWCVTGGAETAATDDVR